jgi:preprotein translocase subunit Sec61beta
MLTQEEKGFIEYWEENRLKKRKVMNQLSVGLPLAVLLVIAIFVNFFSGWDKRATMIINTDPSLIIVLLIACVLIVIFIAIFSFRHKWEQNEQRYQELLNRREKKNNL